MNTCETASEKRNKRWDKHHPCSYKPRYILTHTHRTFVSLVSPSLPFVTHTPRTFVSLLSSSLYHYTHTQNICLIGVNLYLSLHTHPETLSKWCHPLSLNPYTQTYHGVTLSLSLQAYTQPLSPGEVLLLEGPCCYFYSSLLIRDLLLRSIDWLSNFVYFGYLSIIIGLKLAMLL